MFEMIAGYVLILLAVFVLVLQQLFDSIPARELRRLARYNDPWYKALYRPVAYGRSLRLLLWTVFCISLPIGLILSIVHASLLVALATLAVVVILTFVVVPSMCLDIYNVRIAVLVSPLIAKLLSLTYPVLNRIIMVTEKYHAPRPASNLYEADDLLELLETQKDQPHNRMAPEDLESAQRALVFSSRRAIDILHTRSELMLVNAEDSIGPVLLDQLHASGQNVWLVYQTKKNNIIGSLHMSDAKNAREGGRVLDLVHGDLAFVHEDYSLRQVLATFQASGQRMAVVVNKFEELLGTVSLEDAIHELLGEARTAVPDYDSRSSVAAYDSEPEETALPESTEVVE